MTLTKTILLEDDSYNTISFEKLPSTVTKIAINGKDLSPLVWYPYEANIKEYLKTGENTITLTLTGNFRNMLGPHHLGFEPSMVFPACFMKNSDIFPYWGTKDKWTDTYTFTEFGIYLK